VIALAALLALTLGVGSVLMVAAGAAGMAFGIRALRPDVRDIERYLQSRQESRSPGRWSDLFAGTSVVFGLISLLIGILLLLFGLMLILLSP
jgi:hypothetical protein